MAVPAPASTAEAADMVLAGLRYLAAADPTALAAQAQAECLRSLEQADAITAAELKAKIGRQTLDVRPARAAFPLPPEPPGAWSRRARSPRVAQRGEDRVQPAVERPGQL